MPQKVKAVVAKAKDAPVSIETIVIPDPGPGEAVAPRPAGRHRKHTRPKGTGAITSKSGAARIQSDQPDTTTTTVAP